MNWGLSRKLGRYLVFTGFSCYPGGGMMDYLGICETIEEAKKLAHNGGFADWYQIVGWETMEIIEEGDWNELRIE